MSVCVLHFLAQSSKRSVECINESIGFGSLSYFTAVLSLVTICNLGRAFFLRDRGLVIVVDWRAVLSIVLIIIKIRLVKDLVITS